MSATRRPFGFKKAGWKQLLAVLFFVPFIVIGVGLGAALLQVWRSSREVASHHRPMMGMQAHGRVRVAGTATRDRPVVSPLGKEGVGWVGAVGYIAKGSKGRTWFEPVCVRADLSALRMRGSIVHWSLTFAEPHEPVVLGERARLLDALPIVDIGSPAEASPPAPIPEVIQRACGSSLAETGETLAYREAVLPPDAPIEVLGCGDGQRIGRCGDGGSYLLTTAKVSDLVDAQRSSLGFLLLFAGFWNLTIMGVVGLSAVSQLVRTKPTFQERLRAG